MGTKKLFEIVQEKNEKKSILSKLNEEYKKHSGQLTKDIQELERLESIGVSDINIDFVQIAESVLEVRGDPYGKTSEAYPGNFIADHAINDIANGCKHLKIEFFGNKTYDGYYQRCDCDYGYGPKHGGIVDRIELRDLARKRDLTDDEKDACIYYLRNYQKIKSVVPKNL